MILKYVIIHDYKTEVFELAEIELCLKFATDLWPLSDHLIVNCDLHVMLTVQEGTTLVSNLYKFISLKSKI